ncbi:beta-phosphoglucomutase [Kovacikia minuta CCNUW1]|uniref:beta-phosphoglucomutase n=1 Tax=Kovacikia minuta TaxID=2931930 RepID=UPI001CCE20D7|nr:beta-phosphoglucomutase [Kovacikia minuta]UBF24822.1 beta-phosphoglucomutase [Kovacikia minuta CCNUW1]
MDTTGKTLPLTYTDWTLTETQFSPEQLHARETVFTIGNGYLGTRGSFEEGYPNAWAATFIHGVYDDVPVMYTELVNCPDWLPLAVIVNGDRFRLDQGEILNYERSLDLHHGVLSRLVRWRSPAGKTVDLQFERFASLADQHVVVLRCQITPVNFSGIIEVQASINGYPENQGFNHWEWLNQGKVDLPEQRSRYGGVWLQVRTRATRIELGMASSLSITGADASLQVTSAPGYPTLNAPLMVSMGQTVTVDNILTVFTSREVETPVQAAQTKLNNLSPYPELLAAHQQAWEQVWQQSDIVIEGDTTAQLAVRYSLFQLLISAPQTDNRISIPAKTLSGFGYRGHIFWDTEFFILPFFTLTQPALARNLLTYRYHTLEGARRKASHYGYKGAMYAWESALTGDEVTPRWALPNDPYADDIRIWCRDREIHISADIAYAVWHYWQATGDDEWMRDYGAEIVFDTAVFWMSRVEWNTQSERYEIREVIGADEYHEQHVSNNAFTNRIAQWHLEKAVMIYDWLQNAFPNRTTELQQKLQLTPGRRSRWQDIVTNMWIPYDSSSGLIEQFEGFFKLEDINLADYEPRTKSMQVILGIEGANKRQVLKQPDVLMLLYLMRGSHEFPYSQEVLQKNWDYYAPRTDITYGSSLGPAIHAILAADVGLPAESYQRFLQAALVDLENLRSNAAEGIHGASAGGVWQAVVFGFGGIKLTNDGPVAQPHFPPGWTRLRFKLHWRGVWHEFDLKAEGRGQRAEGEGDTEGKAEVRGQRAEGRNGESGVRSQEPESIQNSKFKIQNSPYSPLPTPHSPDLHGVIFDLDGVLTDTAEFHYRAWQRLADEEGLPFNREMNEALRGVSRRESLLLIVGDRSYPEEKLQEMMDRKNRYYVESIQDISPADLLPGALDLLDELRQAGIKTAIGSASKNAHTVIEKLGIADHVDAIADGYSVQNPKPAPDLFLFAARELGLKPIQCVVVEDAAAGIEAALAGGMWAVGLGPKERVGAAHIVLPSLKGIHWADLRVKLNQVGSGEDGSGE